jgi:hypothetical protein
MKYVVEVDSAGTICLPRFMKIGSNFQRVLRFFLNNLRGFNVVVTDVRDLRITPLR